MKKCLCIVISLIMALSLFPVYAFAAGTALSENGGNLASGKYVLDKDVQLKNSLVIAKGKTVDLFLNGYTLTGADSSSVITIKEGAVLNLYDKEDASTELAFEDRGKISGGSGTYVLIDDYDHEFNFGGGLFIEEGASVNIYGGAFTGNYAEYGSAIYNHGSLSIYDCIFKENTAEDSGVIFNEGVFVIDGNFIASENYSEVAAGVIYTRGMLSLGGNVCITDNHAGGYAGGLVSLTGAEGLNFTGGYYNITNNTVMGGQPADMLYSFWGTPLEFTVSGVFEEGSQIGLFAASEDTDEPVYITTSTGQDLGEVFFVNSGEYIVATDADGDTYVRPRIKSQPTKKNPVFELYVKEGETVNYQWYKTSIDGTNEKAINTGKTLNPTGGFESNCMYYCKAEIAGDIYCSNYIFGNVIYSGITFTEGLTKEILKSYLHETNDDSVYELPEGDYFLADDICFSGYSYQEGRPTKINGNTKIYLNGKNFDGKDSSCSLLFEIGEGATLTIYGDGNIEGFSSVAHVGGGRFILNGGTITECECFSRAVIYVESGTFEMNGGYIGKNVYYNWSYAVEIDEGAEFVMLGGRIADNTVDDEDPCGVIVRGKATLGGKAVIYGNTHRDVESCEMEYKDCNLILYDGAKVQISSTTPFVSGAKIGITIDDNNWDTKHDGGDITMPSNSASSAYFVADDNHLKLEVEGLGSNSKVVLTPYKEVSVDLDTQYILVGTENPKFELKTDPAGLAGFKLSYANLEDEEQVFSSASPSGDESGSYLVRIERDGDSVYAPYKDYAVLRIGEECTITFDISTAESGTTPEDIKGIMWDYCILPQKGDIERKGYEFTGWDYDGETYHEEWSKEFEDVEMTMTPHWELILTEQPTKANGYSVKVETNDNLKYQWQKKEKVTKTLSRDVLDSYDEEWGEDLKSFYNDGDYLNMSMDNELFSIGDTFSFTSEQKLECYSETAGTLTKNGNRYTYTFKSKWCSVRIENVGPGEGIDLSDCKVSYSGFADIKGETSNKLKNAKAGNTYRCVIGYDDTEKITEEINVVNLSDVNIKAWFRNAAFFCVERVILPIKNGLFGSSSVVSKDQMVEAITNMAEKYDWWFDEDIFDQFEDSEAVSREDAVRMLYAYVQSRGEGFDGDWMFNLEYEDVDEISEDAYEAVAFFTMKGVISGCGEGKFMPHSEFTKGELAKLIMAYVTTYNE